MRLTTTITACVLALASTMAPMPAASAMAAPEPLPVPRAWELVLTPGPLRVTRLSDGEGGTALYYYMTYMVVNDTGQDVFFAPLFELGTDKGELLVAGQNVPREATAELVGRLDSLFIQDQISIIGQLRQGVENAKEGVILWPVGRTDVDEVSVYAVGFSGENRTLKVRDPGTGELKDVVLRKTMWLRHRVPGDIASYAAGEGGLPLPRAMDRWILRKPEASVAAANRATAGDTADDSQTTPRASEPNRPRNPNRVLPSIESIDEPARDGQIQSNAGGN